MNFHELNTEAAHPKLLKFVAENKGKLMVMYFVIPKMQW